MNDATPPTSGPRRDGLATDVTAADGTVGMRRQRSGRWWSFLWVLLVVVAVGVQHPEFPDRGTANITSVVCGVLLILSFLFWVIRFSRYAKLGRILLGLVVLLALVAVLLFRAETWRGGMRPELVFRWSPRPDQSLRAIATEQVSAVDLSQTVAGDFPQFLGPKRTNAVDDVQLLRDWSTFPTLIWKQPIGAGWSGFAAVNGYAVTLEQRGPAEILACYEIATGKAVWTHEEQTRHESPLGYIGPRSTPTIHNGRVYAQGATGRLVCVEGSDGSVVWRHDLFEEQGMDKATAEAPVPWGRSASPLIVDNKVIVPVGGPTDGPYVTLIAFDVDRGEEVWRAGGYQISYASPQLMTLDGVRQIVSVNQSFVSAHSVDDGTLLWDHPWFGLSNLNASVSQPVQVAENRVYLSKGYATGSELIEVTETDGRWNAESLWSKRTMKTKFSNVSVFEGFVYGLDEGVLACQEIESGKRQWKRGRYGFGQSMRVGDVILVLDEDGVVHMVDASSEQHNELGQFPAIDGMTWNTMCLIGDLLLVRNANEAACYRLPLRESVRF